MNQEKLTTSAWSLAVLVVFLLLVLAFLPALLDAPRP